MIFRNLLQLEAIQFHHLSKIDLSDADKSRLMYQKFRTRQLNSLV